MSFYFAFVYNSRDSCAVGKDSDIFSDHIITRATKIEHFIRQKTIAMLLVNEGAYNLISKYQPGDFFFQPEKVDRLSSMWFFCPLKHLPRRRVKQL